MHDGLNSSTSSLDSAMCLDSTSSLDPSPISSASSSFAPQPTGKQSEDDQNVKDTCMTQVCSKLCTERQRADESNFSINSNLDGSASSISSNDSCHTLKQEEEDGGVFIPQSTTPPPPHSQRCESSSSVVGNQSTSRPSSGLRVTTPLPSNIVSYAPETIEKLKKLEKLKQKKKNVDGEPEKCSMDRRFSSPVTSKLKVGSLEKSPQEEIKEEKDIEKSPVGLSSGQVSTELKHSSPVSTRYQTSPVPSNTKQSPAPTHKNQNPKVGPSSETVKLSNKSSVSSNETPLVSSISITTRSTKPSSPLPSIKNSYPAKENSPQRGILNIKGNTPTGSIATTHSVSFNTTTSPINNRSKSYSPQVLPKPLENSSNRSIKLTSPSQNTDDNYTSTGTPVVIYRNKSGKNQVRESWRKTPHIDPDAIEALLNLDEDVDPNELIIGGGGEEPFKIGTEKQDSTTGPTQAKSPEIDLRKKLFEGQQEDKITSILRKSPGSDSDIVRRPKRIVTISSKRSKHQSIYFGSPERSPGFQDKTSPRINKISSNLQRSLTMSHSSPDLTAILGHKSRKKLKREDTYVTGSCTPKESNRRSFFGGSPLNRSVTMTAGSKGNNNKGFLSLKEKYMSKK